MIKFYEKILTENSNPRTNKSQGKRILLSRSRRRCQIRPTKPNTPFSSFPLLVSHMLPRLTPLLRNFHPTTTTRAMPRVLTCAAPLHSLLPPPSSTPLSPLAPKFQPLLFHNNWGRLPRPLVAKNPAGNGREYRKVRRRGPTATRRKTNKEVELSVGICIEDELPDDPEISSIVELLKLDAPMTMKMALEALKDSQYKTRDTAVSDIGGYDTVELSIMLCNDGFIRELNKEWRDEDSATDVLSMSQHVPGLQIPILMLGDVVISVETAARQAAERGHSLVDEIRILLVHGLLHLLGFDHEVSEEAEAEMEKEEEFLLKSLGWTGKGLIHSAQDNDVNPTVHTEAADDRKKEGSLRFYKPKFSYIFCDMDGTLLNSKSQISTANARALKEAVSRGVKVVIATGKARPAAISILKMVDLVGKDGVISEFSPGVFLQGLLVYGRQGREIFRRNLDPKICREACEYSLEHKVPLIAFCEGRCLTLFGHPLVDSLHTIYHEPKAEIMPSIEHLLAAADIQKLLYYDTAENVSTALRPYWSQAAGDSANVVQAVPEMLEIVPLGTSKGRGVKMLLDHLGATPEEIMALGDGENDIEMLELASLGIALSNGAEKTKAVADVIGPSNDEDGVADSIYRYAF